MTKISTKPPSGMRDYLPTEVARRRYVMDVVREVYERYGFAPLETPTIERLSTLTGKYGEEGDQLLYRLLHRRDALKRAVEQAHGEGRAAKEAELADLGLRYDLTVPLARVVANYGDLPRFFKRYQIQPVWRADRPGRGRYREFYQCDVDITGTTSQVADAEVCNAVSEVLERLGFAQFELRLNHRGLLRAMVRSAGIDAAAEGQALISLDKLDKIGADGVVAELAERGIDETAARELLRLCEMGLDELAAHVDDEGARGIESIRELQVLCAEGPAKAHLRFSPTLARGLSYYTGPIFEISTPDFAPSLGGGGRYDELVGMFGKTPVPAVGFALGFERIVLLMAEREMYPDLAAGPQVLLCWLGTQTHEVLRVAGELRAAGLRVEVYPEPAKLKKQLTYANTEGVGVAWAAILGEDELAEGRLTMKNLESGEQQRVTVDEAAALVQGAS